MKYVLLFILFSCCISTYGQVLEDARVDVSLQFIKKEGNVDIKVTLHYPVVSNNTLSIGNLKDYYGSSLSQYMTEVKGDLGTVVSVNPETDSITIVPANEEVNFTYTLAYDSTTLTSTYAPNVGKDHVHFAFCQWMLPIVPRETVLEYSIQVDRLPVGWMLYNSVNSESLNILIKGSLHTSFSMIVGAGVFYKKSYTLEKRVVNVFIAGRFDIDRERLAELVYKTVTNQHTWMNDFNFSFYNVAILPREGSVAGIAVPNMFLCYLKQEVEYRKLAWLMSHEMFHRWIGNQIVIKDTTSYRLRHQWFKEGINDYMSYLSLLDSRLFTKDDFINSINLYLKNVKENPYADASEDSINHVISAGKYGVAATKLAYYKGMLIGFIADHTLCVDPDGVQSDVKNFILRISKESAGEENGEVDERRFFFLSDSMKLPLYSLFEKHIIKGGADFNLPKRVFNGDYKLKKTRYAIYDPGFRSLTKDAHLYTSVVDPSGPAYECGVRDNMEIISSTAANRFSNAWCDCPIKLVLLVDGQQKTFEYMPRGKIVDVEQYVKR
jgi:predicted metalloprotease with PDZ domain